MRYFKNLDGRKILQIAMVYVLALVAAVACGEAFPVKKLKIAGTNAAGRATLPFQPTITSVNKESNQDRNMTASSLGLNIQIIDDGQTVQLMTYHSGAGESISGGRATAGPYNYAMITFCRDAACNEVGLLITRKNNSNGATQQTGFHLVTDTAGQLNLAAPPALGSNFANAEEALNIR